MIESLKECPHCAGTLNDAGRCTYCGSKVYDFMAVDFVGGKSVNAQTYIRIRTRLRDGATAIVTVPISISDVSLTRECDPYRPEAYYYDGSYLPSKCLTYRTTLDIHCDILGDIIAEEEDI